MTLAHKRRMVRVALAKLERGCDFPQDARAVLRAYRGSVGQVLRAQIDKAFEEDK